MATRFARAYRVGSGILWCISQRLLQVLKVAGVTYAASQTKWELLGILLERKYLLAILGIRLLHMPG